MLLLAALLTVTTLAAEDDPLQGLRRTHPRLFASDADLEKVRKLIASDPQARMLHRSLRQEAEKLLTAEPVVFKLIGPRLLDQSRRAVSRIYTLGLAYRLDGDRRFLDRAVKELRAASEFPSWNPSHFLDTAEMTHAFAIGYDWLYPALSEGERSFIRQAIIEKGIREALPIYEKQRWWSVVHHNWNQVCNGGIGMGALAIANEEPELARTTLRYALQSIPRAIESYAPDGGWNEGPGYWEYATRYTTYFLASLESALGTDFGLSQLQGFDHAGHFRMHSVGPIGYTFNYADAHERAGSATDMLWLARRFQEPVYAWAELHDLKETSSADALKLLWYTPKQTSPAEANWPLDALFTGVQVAFLRSSWTDRNAVYVAIKGGDNKANHSHLDLGSFVLDALGTRWADDLGGDEYNMPNYFGDKRWTYYRLRTESHNTVMIDNENQNPKAAARILDHDFQPKRAMIRYDLAAAYPKLNKHERTLTLVDRKEIRVLDEIEAKQPVEALWGMVTDADVKLDGRRAHLTKNGRLLEAEIVSPVNAEFAIVSTAQEPPQNPNSGTRKLTVRLPERVTAARIEVALKPIAGR